MNMISVPHIICMKAKNKESTIPNHCLTIMQTEKPPNLVQPPQKKIPTMQTVVSAMIAIIMIFSERELHIKGNRNDDMFPCQVPPVFTTCYSPFLFEFGGQWTSCSINMSKFSVHPTGKRNSFFFSQKDQIEAGLSNKKKFISRRKRVNKWILCTHEYKKRNRNMSQLFFGSNLWGRETHSDRLCNTMSH